MADIFRKSITDKLSSPEQLDRSIRIIPPSFWIAVAGGGLIIAVALLWSIFGRLPVSVSAGGMYMGRDGIHSVVAQAEGVVDTVYVSEGQDVKSGQEIASLSDKVYADEMQVLQERRGSVEAVTFYSYDDDATPDNKALIDIKSQRVVSGSGLTTDQELLSQKSKDLKKARKAASSAHDKMTAAEAEYKKAAAEFTAAQEAYAAAEEAYKKDPTSEEKAKAFEAAAIAMNAAKAASSAAETAYSTAAQTYNTNYSEQKSLEGAVSQLEAQVRADKKNKGSQDSALEMQFDSAKESALAQIDSDIRKLQTQIDALTLRSSADGKVTGLNIAAGNAVQAGATICRITTGNEDDSEVVCYIPVAEGRKIKKGMDVYVYPSTVNRQEQGHMVARVTSVSDYVVSQEEMLNQLGDATLVQAFLQSGPVVRVVCDLEKDESTASGYKWSSKKGADITLEEGTVVTADIVTEKKAPITMLIPLLKEKFTGDEPVAPTQPKQTEQSTAN